MSGGYPNDQGNPGGAIPVYLAAGGSSANKTDLNLTAPGETLKAGPGAITMVSVVVAGNAPGAVYDCAAIGDIDPSNQVAVIPNAVGSYPINFPCLVGVTVVPGTGQTVAAAYQ